VAGRKLEIGPIGLRFHPLARRRVGSIVRVRAGDVGLRKTGAEQARSSSRARVRDLFPADPRRALRKAIEQAPGPKTPIPSSPATHSPHKSGHPAKNLDQP
jgi:hypothetical protein